MLHKIDDTQNVLKRDGRTKATIKRNQLAIKVEPDTLNGHLATDLKAGQYELRVHSPGKLDVYVWCGSDLADGEYGFEIPTQIRGSHRPALDPIIEVVDMNQVGWMGGADNIVTAAASDARTAALEVASFSSRGQLVQYDTDFKRNQTKPDVAAPGVEIHGAGSQDHRPPLPGKIKMWSGNGSSAATPHITGTIALMLEKNRALTTNKIIETLTAQADKNPAPDPDEAGAGWLNAKKCVDNTPQG
jgi:hypothetical protein